MSAEDTKPSYVEKIYTSTGITKENVFTNGEKVLHIGSGTQKLPGTVTIDVLDLPTVDIVHDLDIIPWPFENNEFDLIYAHSVFEHLEDLVAVVEEMSRILKPGGRVVITVPHFRCVDAFTDPTHTHFFTTKTLDYFIDGTNLEKFKYSKTSFKKIGFWFGWPVKSKNPIVRMFKSYISNHTKFYDSYLSLLFPVNIIIWELEVIK